MRQVRGGVWRTGAMVAGATLASGAVSGDPLAGQEPGQPLSARVQIELEHGSEGEQAAADQLRRLLDAYDVARWTWTERVRIDETAIPHSHPVLTLHTRSVGAGLDQLATYLHEQFHWWVDERSDAEGAAIAEFRELFPEVPVAANGGGGARDEYSTYLHLIVCDLEFQAMAALVGDARAREILASYRHYRWIYDQVLTDPRVREVNLRHGFDVGAGRAEGGGAGGGAGGEGGSLR